MLLVFEAHVTDCIKCENGFGIILDETAFFPGGGGQEADTGIIEKGNGSIISVDRVQVTDGNILHITDAPIDAGEKVTGRVDVKTRLPRMQKHGAEHLICGLVHERFGYENVGFHMTDEETVFDVGGPLTKEEIRDIERRANEIIYENVPITISFPSAEEAADIKYRSKLDISEGVRLVTIEGYDVCACCAPHVASTGQIGVIKILSAMPHRGGMRMTITAGLDAYSDYFMLHEQNAVIMDILSAKRNLTAEYTKDMADRMAALKEENRKLKIKLTAMETERILGHIKSRDPKDSSPEVIFSDELDPKGLRDLVNSCTAVFDGIVCAFLFVDDGYRYIFAVREDFAKDYDIRSLSARLNEKLGGRGGGSEIMVQGNVGATRSRIEEFFATN